MKYSLRTFAKEIQVPVSTLSRVMNGKLKLSPSSACEILKRLPESEKSVNHLLFTLMKGEISLSHEEMNSAQYLFLTDWAYPAIFHSFFLADLERKPEALAMRFGLSVEKVHAVLEKMLEIGLLKRTEDNQLTPTTNRWTTSDQIPNHQIQEHHRQGLIHAMKTLESHGVEERDFTSYTFVGTDETYKDLKKQIRELYQKAACVSAASESPNRIFKMAVHLYPLDKVKDEPSLD